MKYFQQYIKKQVEEKIDDFTRKRIVHDISSFFDDILHGDLSNEDEILDIIEEIAQEAVKIEISKFLKAYPKESIEKETTHSIRNEIISLVTMSEEDFVSEIIANWREIDLYQDLIAEIEYLSHEKNVNNEISNIKAVDT